MHSLHNPGKSAKPTILDMKIENSVACRPKSYATQNSLKTEGTELKRDKIKNSVKKKKKLQNETKTLRVYKLLKSA